MSSDLVGPRHTMQASFSTGRKLLIEIKRLETIRRKDNDKLGFLNAQTSLQVVEGF